MTAVAADVATGTFACELPQRPYPGLRPFEPAEWPVFFGRERMTDDVITRLTRERLLVVHGDSGCGKSSLICAGVLPNLEHSAARGGARWRTCSSLPGEHPLLNLAIALAGLDGRAEDPNRVVELRRLLNYGREGAAALVELLQLDATDQVCILVDQFEELFAHAKRYGPHEASLLVEFLIGIERLPDHGLCAALTLRSEFLGACAKFPGFAETVNATQYLLPRMEHADLLRSIREPATLYNGEIELALAERLIADAGGAQDQLPLIQHGLMLLHRDHVVRPGLESTPWTLTAKACALETRRLGRLLSDHADEVAHGVGDARTVEAVFRALTDINSEGHAVRRPQRLGQLVATTDADEVAVREIVDAFRAEGVSFLRPYAAKPLDSDARIDISHEALIRCWRKIASDGDGWLGREFKDGLVWRSLLVQADSFEQDGKSVLSPATTEERTAWLEQRTPEWSKRYGGGWDRVQKLMVASIAESARRRAEIEKERLRHQRAKLNLLKLRQKVRTARILKMGLAAVLMLALLASWLALTAFHALENEKSAQNQADQAVQGETKARFAASVGDESDRSARERAEDRRQLIGDAVETLGQQLDNVQATMAALPANGAAVAEIARAQGTMREQLAQLSKVAYPPRIYGFVSSDSQYVRALQLRVSLEKSSLNDEQIVVPRIERGMSAANVLRCFSAEDCAKGYELLETVNGFLAAPTLRLEDATGSTLTKGNTPRPHQYEVRFGPGTIELR